MREHEWSVLIHKENILNSNDRKHWGNTKQPKSNLRTMGAAKQRELPRMERVQMDVWVSYPPDTYPDAANLHPTMKSYLDGLCHPDGKRKRSTGILPDDSDKHVAGPYIHWSGWGSGKPGWYLFRVRLTELEPWVQPAKPAYL